MREIGRRVLIAASILGTIGLVWWALLIMSERGL